MYVAQKDYKSPSSIRSSAEDSDLGSFSDCTEAKTKPVTVDHGFVPRAGGLVKGLVDNLSLAKFQSICTINDKSASPRIPKNDINEIVTKIMLRRGSHMETDWECEGESKAKLNSVISIMISTIMCLAAKCPVPRSNIQATKLFLSTVVNDNGESPRNIKALLTLLKTYDGPYDGEPPRVIKSNSPPPTVEISNTTTVVLEPAIPPPAQPVDKVRASQTRSRLPSLSPSRETPTRGSKTGVPDKLRVSYKKSNYT